VEEVVVVHQEMHEQHYAAAAASPPVPGYMVLAGDPNMQHSVQVNA